jgi:hypothetical protein
MPNRSFEIAIRKRLDARQPAIVAAVALGA